MAVTTTKMKIELMLDIVKFLAQDENLEIMRQTPKDVPPGEESPLYTQMQDTKYRNARGFNARRTFEHFLADAARKLKTKKGAKEFAESVARLIPSIWKKDAAKKVRQGIWDNVPKKFMKQMSPIAKPADEKAAEAAKAKERADENSGRVIQFDAKEVYDAQSKLATSEDKYDHVLACMLACGARPVEILSTSYGFDEIPDSKHEVWVEGVAKGSSKKYVKGAMGVDVEIDDGEGGKRKISQQEANLMKRLRRPILGNPTHMNVPKFLKMVKGVREFFKTEGRTNESLSKSFNHGLNKSARAAFANLDTDNVPHTSYLCRYLYMALAWDEYGQHKEDEKKRKMNQVTYLQRIIGHTSPNTTALYMRFIVRKETVADQTATVARLESKVEELQQTVAEVKEVDPRYEQAYLMRKDPHTRDGNENKLKRLKKRIAELQEAGITPTEKILKSIGYGSRVIQLL